MENSCLLLLKIQLINNFRLNDIRLEKDKKKLATRLIVFSSFVLLGLLLVTYCFVIAYNLGQMGLATIIPSYALTISSLLTFFLTLLKANGVLFAYKDYDLLMALPVKTSTIIASRFLTLYLMNMLCCFLIMLPMGVAYCLFMKPSFFFYFVWLVGTFLASLIPTTFATMLGALIIYGSSRFKYSNAVTTIFSFILFLGIMIAPMFLKDSSAMDVTTATLTQLSTLLSTQINKIYPVALLFSKAATEASLVAFSLFILLSVGWYYLFIKVLAIKYKFINTSLMTHATNSHFKAIALQEDSPLKALYQKELKRFFSTSIYVLNTGIGALMAIAASIGFLFVGAENLDTLLGMPGALSTVMKLFPFILSALLTMSCTSSVALSLEGKNLWIIKSSPITIKTLLDSKILVNLTVLLPTSILSSLLVSIALRPDWFHLLLFFVTPIVYSFFTGVWGIFINLKFPRYEWESETQIVKQSTSSMVGMLGGTLFALVPLGVILLIPTIDACILTVLFTLLIALLTCLLYTKVCHTKSL